MHCSTRLYQDVLEQCMLVSHLRCHSILVDGQILANFDDNVDNVLGITILYQYVQTESKVTSRFEQNTKPLCNVITTKCFLEFFRLNVIRAVILVTTSIANTIGT